jgi:catechol 2,3-dioxygenase-like lactoylglutathione lyase family enzyme
MFDHVTIRVSDREAAERFYDTVLPVLGLSARAAGPYTEWGDFSLAAAARDAPVTRGLHVGFAASSRARVDQFWRTGTKAGFEDDGAPGPRPQYGDDYYGGFLLDPDGNSIEAVHHGTTPAAGRIDHLWIRVADVAASTVFYDTIAPFADYRLRRSTPERAQFTSSEGSFSVVTGRPTQPFHLAFATDSDATVQAFHRAALEAGYRNNGAPGERAVYHPGYYGAFILDPDGNNVEVVNHNRRP